MVVRRAKCRVEEYATSEGLVISMYESKQHGKGLQHDDRADSKEREMRQFNELMQ